VTIKHNKRRNILIAIAALVVIIIGLEVTNTTHFFHKSAKVSSPSKPITGLPAKKPRDKDPSTQTSTANQGTTTDKNGQTTGDVSNDPSKWATSTSGRITLKAPTNNGTLRSGGIITGSASGGPVQYRLIDNQAGVISQGSISVVNGNFTASINFKPYASNGRLDVFNIDSTGRELNEVQVSVNF
jgi:hypothetical protein